MRITNALIYFLFIFFSFSTKTFSQSTKIDSLKIELQNHKTQDTVRAKLLYDLAFSHFQKDMKLTQSYLAEAEIISNTLDYKKGKAGVLYIKGILESRKSNYETGSIFFNESIKLFEAINDKKGIASVNNAIGINYYKQSQYEEALKYLKKTYNFYEETGDEKNIISPLLNIGSIYAETGRYTEAIFNYKKVLKISEKNNLEYGTAYAISNLGHIYEDQGNFPLALEYYSKGLSLKEKVADTLGMSISLNSIGNVYSSLENYDKSLYYFNKSLKLQYNGGQKGLIATIIGNIGLVYKNKKEYDKALKYMNESLELSREVNNLKQVSNCFNNIGEIYLLINNPIKARNNFEKGNTISKEIGYQLSLSISYLGIAEAYLDEKNYNKALFFSLKGQEIANQLKLLKAQKKASELLSGIYKNTGNYKKALESYEQFKILNDSLFNKENIEKITQLEYEYKYNQALDSASIRELKLTKTITATSKDLEQSKQNYLWAVIGFLLISILLGFIIFNLKLRNVKSKTQNIIIEQKLLRSQMTPHFVFNSLSVLQGMILNKEEKKSIYYLSKFSKLLRIILENSRDQTVLLSQELMAIENYLALQNLENEDYQYSITVEETIDVPLFEIPPMLIQPFVENSIEHAFLNKQEDKKIEILLTYLDNKLICTITDNGIGIDSHKETKNHHKKSLATTITYERLKMLSKDLKMKGSLTIEDRKKHNEQGTIVTLEIPHKIHKI